MKINIYLESLETQLGDKIMFENLAYLDKNDINIDEICCIEIIDEKLFPSDLSKKICDELSLTFPELTWLKILYRFPGHFFIEFMPSRLGHSIETRLRESLCYMGYTEESIYKKFCYDLLEIFEASVKTLIEENTVVERIEHRIEKEKTNGKKKKIKQKSIIFLPLMIGLFLTILLIIISLQQFVSAGKISGDSMLPTLRNNQIVAIFKSISELKRGDIISFKLNAYDHERFVKRIIGLPGDEIYTSEGYIYVNGQPIQGEYQKVDNFDLYSLTGQKKVPEKHFFVLGDNINNSTDSRSFGFVAEEEIEGKLIY